MLLLGFPAMAQIVALEDITNNKGYTIQRYPTSNDDQRFLYAAGNNTQVGTETATTNTDTERWAVYTSGQTGNRYVYNLSAKKFLTNTAAGCSLQDAASPTFFIETWKPGNWMLMNNNMLTGADEENSNVIFSKNETFATDNMTFLLNETTRTLTTEELTEIENKVNNVEKDIRNALLEEIKTLIDQARQIAALGKSDFAGNYDYADLQTAYNHPDDYSNEELKQLMNLTQASVYPQEGKYYRIINSSRPNDGEMTNVLTITAENNLGVRKIENCIPGIRNTDVLETLGLFQFFNPAGSNSFVLYHPSAKIYAGASASGTFIPLKSNLADAAPYNLIYENNLLFRLQNSNNTGLYITANGESNCVSYDKIENPELWYFQEVKSIDITINNSGYATTCLPCAIELPEEIDAYVGVSQENHTLHMKKVENYTGNKILPAYLPVILKRRDDCTETSFECPIVYDTPQTEIPNLLKGTTLRSLIEEGSYILYQGTDKTLGFYLVDPNDREVNSNKAYLPGSPLYPSQSFVFSFDDQITAISALETNVDEKESLYDLNGKKVVNPQKGVYITNKGKKIIIK